MAPILVIEDDIIIRNGLLKLLAKEGYTTQFADNGADGVKLAKEHSPSIIICDIAMPQMDGYQVLAEVRALPQFADTPFLFLSAKITADDEKRGLAAGATAYLKKPMWPDDIIAAVKKYVVE
jgi:CheY-like chemotaxis protein